MRRQLRSLGSLLLALCLMVPLAATPLGVALSASGTTRLAADSALTTTGLEPTALGGATGSSGTLFSDGQGHELTYLGPVDGFLQSIDSGFSGPMEVIIGLQGRSLAEEQAYRAEAGLPLLGVQAQRAYLTSLRESQAPLMASLQAGGATILYDYQIAFNGFSAVVEPKTLQSLGAPQGIRSIEMAAPISMELDNSVPYIFGGQSHAELGYTGAGVTIAIIDTGVDYYHAALGGSGNPADYAADDPTIIEAGTFPNAKVIGGTDLVGEFYNANCDPIDDPTVCSSIPFPDPDPVDLIGHGSHVSGIAAGLGSASVSVGVAPDASILAVKVFGTGSVSTSVLIAAFEVALDPNGDLSIDDAVDVINMSLGAAYGRSTETLAVATDAVVSLGVVVAASAGNEADFFYITGAPGAASQAISVAAGNDPGVSAPGVTFEPDAGGLFTYGATDANFGPPVTAPVAASAFDVGGTACTPIPADLTGTIALIDRGACSFVTKVRNAQNGGAVGVTIANNVPGLIGMADDGTGGDIVIPALMITQAAGAEVRANLPGTLTLLALPQPAAEMAGFSSRGPRFGDSDLKPDITAPGVQISSVLVGSGTGAVNLGGTSMSSPHIAGSAALLLEAHPSWSPAMIKAALMNTATNAMVDGTPYPVSRMGAGIVQVDEAVKTSSLVVPSSASFGVEERDRHGRRTFTEKLRVWNLGDERKTFELTSDFLFANDDEGSIQIDHPHHIKVGAGHSKNIKLQLKVNFAKLAPEAALEEYDGFLTLTEVGGDGDVLRVPFHIIPYARSDAKATDHKIRLDDEWESEVALSGDNEVPAVETEAFGEVEVEIEERRGKISLEYELEVCNIEDVLMAHIHAPAGPTMNAGIALWLYGPGPLFSTEECEELAEDELSQSELESALVGISLEDFLAALRSGQAYVNVHTVANPAGEIRGQLLPEEELTLKNKGIAGTLVDIYQFGVKDPNEDLIMEPFLFPNDPDDFFDLKYTGVHVLPFAPGFTVLEFATVTYGMRSVANRILTEVYIDVDEDGIPEYLVQAADLGLFLNDYPLGDVVSGVFDLQTGAGFLEFFVFDAMNTAIQTVPILLEDLNFIGFFFGRPMIDPANPDFDYFIVTHDLETGAFDVSDVASFNAITPLLDTSPNFLFLPAKSRADVLVLAGGEGSLLILFYNNLARDQGEIVKVVEGHGHHGHHDDDD